MHAPGGVRFIRNENRMEWKARTITSAFKKETFNFDNRVIPDFGEKLRVSLAYLAYAGQEMREYRQMERKG